MAPGHQLAAVAAREEQALHREPHPAGRLDGEKDKYGDGVARYLRLTGTSMAAAVTSGIVAMMIEAANDSVRPSGYDGKLQYYELLRP